MREIKFRFFDEANREMHGVYSINFFTETVRADDGTDRNLNETNLMQYTGLKDMNGDEVYDGDILEFIEYEECLEELIRLDFKGTVMNEYRLVVGVMGEGLVVVARDIDSSIYNYTNNELRDMVGTGEVVGNIHEHPELIQ